MATKSKVRVKLPNKSPLFKFKLRDFFKKARLLDDDEDHVVLEFDTAEDAADALKEPITIQGHALEMEALATERDVTPPKTVSFRRSNVMGNLQEELPTPAQASGGNTSEKGREEDSSERACGDNVIMWKSSDLSLDEEPGDNAVSNTDDNFNQLLHQERNTYMGPVHAVPGNHLQLAGLSDHLTRGPSNSPSTGVSMVSDPMYALIRSDELFDMCDDFSIPAEYAPPPPQGHPRHGKLSTPPTAPESPCRLSSSSAENQARIPIRPNRPLPEIPVDQERPWGELDSTHVYDSLRNFSFPLDYPSLDMTEHPQPVVTASAIHLEVPSTTSLRDVDLEDDASLFGSGDDDGNDGNDEDSSSKYDYGLSTLPSALDTGRDDINYSIGFEQDFEIANAPPPDHHRARDYALLQGRMVEKQGKPITSSQEGAVRNTRETPQAQRTSDKVNRDHGDDDDDDDNDDDDDGPMELTAFLRRRAVADGQPLNTGGAGNKDTPKLISRHLSLPLLTLKLLVAKGKLASRPGVRVRQREDSKVFLEGEEKTVLQMEKEMQSEAVSLHPMSRSLPKEQLDLLKSKGKDARAAIAALNIRGIWVVYDGHVHAAGTDKPEILLDVLENFCSASCPSLPQPAQRMPEATSSPSRHAQPEGVVTVSLKVEDVLVADSAKSFQTPFKMDEAWEFLKKNQENLFGTLGRDEDPELTLTLSKENDGHCVKVTGKKSVVDNVLAIVRIHLEDVTQMERVFRDEAVTSVWKNGKGQEVIREVQRKFSNYIITAEALPEESSTQAVSTGTEEEEEPEIDNDSGSNEDLDDDNDSSSDSEISNSPSRSPSPQARAVRSQAARVEGSVLHVLPAMSVRREDLLKLHVDAIVHGTDDQLAFATNLGKALLQQVGTGLQQTCTQYVQQRGRLAVGSVYCTPAGAGSKFSAVVHASLPKATNGRADARLKDTVAAALTAAKAQGHRTVALPALGAKSCDFSPVDAVLSVIQGVAAFSLASPFHGLHHVTLCDVSEDTHKVFQAVLPEVWALDEARLRASLKLDASVLVADSELQKSGSNPPQVQLVLGSIQNQKADVIVNSTRSDLNLASGSISKSLATAAGPRLQREAQVKSSGGLSPGRLCVTSGGQLSCKAVFHIMLPEYGGDDQTKVLETTVSLCLEEAERAGHSSIAFPPLGTGNLHFPRHVVMATILKCVTSFRQRHGNPSLKQVTLVAYPRDFDSVQPFRKSMAEFIKTGKIVAEATPTSHQFKVGSIKVDITRGDITREKTDAILNGCQDDMDLDKGFISKAILQAAGPGLQTECSKLAPTMAKNKVVVSGPGKLGCKKIIHVVTQSSADHWRAVWPKVFESCQTQKVTSLAIPPIGTGGMKISPKDMGGLLCEAMKKVPSQGSLTTVRVLFPNQEKLDDFASGFREKNGGPAMSAPPAVPAMTTEEVTLGCLSVTVALGDITWETTDAIVDFCNPNMDLSQGILPSLILKAAGPSLQQECDTKKADMKKTKVVVTGSGNLKCKKVIHVPRAESASKLSEAVTRAAITAQSEDFTRISFPAPAIGGRFDAVAVAGAMFEGLKKAGGSRGTPVRVRLVLKSPDAVGAFVQQLRGLPVTSPAASSTLPARMRPAYSERRPERRQRASFPRARQMRGGGREGITLESCTVPVRVRVTGMGEVVRALEELPRQCRAKVIQSPLLG